MTERTCAIEGCDRPVPRNRKGWCEMHYGRWWRHGDPTVLIRERDPSTVATRWVKRVRVESPGCWIWQALLNPDGYGIYQTALPDRSQLAHRFVYEELVGTVPAGLQLDHLCRVRRCVNPDHLEPVTPAENIRRSARHYPKAQCRKGHALTEQNTHVHTDRHGVTRRRCRKCSAESTRRARLAA
jgi:hypothetical protein